MDAWQDLINTGVLTLELATLAGLLVRRRARRMVCLPFCLASLLIYGVIVAAHPPFLTWRSWLAKESLFAALSLAIGVELAARLFGRLPRAASHARYSWTLVLLLAAAVTQLDLPVPQRGPHLPADLGELTAFETALRWLPRLNYALAWLFLALYALAAHYAVVLDPLHRIVVPSFGTYLLVYALSLGMLQAEHQARLVSDVQTLSFLVLLLLWSWAAWRPEREPPVARDKLRRLWPWM